MKKGFSYLNKQQEKLVEEVQKLMEERGRKPLEMARKSVLEEEIECKEVKEALHYFMTEYWQDLARPTLMSICCEAVGGDPKATTVFAVPLSLISGALDIHDDIIDQSKTKYGRPTVYGKYGKEIAILTADALLFKGFTLLNEACTQISKEKSQKIMKTVKEMFCELGDAEALELNLRGRLDIAPEEYVHIVEKKSADAEALARIGGVLGNGYVDELEALGNYGRRIGMLIILSDDLMDCFDEKELKHRIKYEVIPLPLMYAVRNLSVKEIITDALRKGRIITNDVRILIRAVEKGRELKLFMDYVKEVIEKTEFYISYIRRNSHLKLLMKAVLIPFQNYVII